MVRIDLEGGLEVLPRLGGLTAGVHNEAEGVLDIRILRIEFGGFLEAREGVLVVVVLQVEKSQRIMGMHIVRVEFDGSKEIFR